MAKLKKRQEVVAYSSFDDMFADIYSAIREKLPTWHVVPAKRGVGMPFDYLLMKTFKNKITRSLNADSPNPVHVEKELPYQANVGVRLNFDGFETDMTVNYVVLSIFAKNFATIKTGLEDVERYYK